MLQLIVLVIVIGMHVIGWMLIVIEWILRTMGIVRPDDELWIKRR